MNTTTAIMAEGGRNASRARREQLAQGKAALPPPSERKRTGERSASLISVEIPTRAVQAPTLNGAAMTNGKAALNGASAHNGKAEQNGASMLNGASALNGHAGLNGTSLLNGKAELNGASAPAMSALSRGISGRDLSRARRQAMAQGKHAVRQFTGATSAAPSAAPVSSAVSSTASASSSASPAMPTAGSARMAAQAMRAARARHGRGDQAPQRPSAHVRNATQLNYAPKVMTSETYSGGKVTGVRIGRGMNVTGDERGSSLQVTGSQYIGKETGFQPREGGIKVGASRTTGGLMVTGTQVRSKVSITGDEYGNSVRITGEADQTLSDDLLERRESGAYASMQFQRQHNPHGHTVFGTNLGRSAKAVGSRERSRDRALEFTEDGLPISGTAVGRSGNVTGDESGSCRPITGDQYLMPGARQSLCETGNNAARAGKAFTRNGRIDPVTGAKVAESETWTHQRITGVDVEHNDHVTGDEYGVCSPITGTPYVGPTQYESVCEGSPAKMAQPTAGCRVTGDTPLNVDHVTGTHRGSERSITGTPYYREPVAEEKQEAVLAHINTRFSVHSPQREAQLRADANAAQAPSAVGRITGSFAVGHGKITGNQEFHFSPRANGERAARARLTGEGRVEGLAITGSAWSENKKVTGTEDYIAVERNPSERAGERQNFAGSSAFKGKARHEESRKVMVTGMVGWTAKSAARVTLSGGAQG